MLQRGSVQLKWKEFIDSVYVVQKLIDNVIC